MLSYVLQVHVEAEVEAGTFVLEAELMARLHEICKHGVLHYFTVAIFGLCYVHIVFIFVITKDKDLAVKMWC